MTATIQHMARDPRARIAMLALLAAISGVTALLIIAPRSGSNSETGSSSVGTASPVAERVGQGGGGEPPARLLEVFNSLPVPPGLTTDQAPVSTGGNLMAFYWAKEEPQQVLAFYNTELVALGWQAQALSTTVVSGPKLDGTQATVLLSTFVKDDLTLGIGAGENSKAPWLGATQLSIGIQLR